MTRTWSHLRAVLALPVMVTLVGPGLVLWLSGGHPAWTGTAAAWSAAAGVLLVAAGLAMLAWTVGLFGTVGQGTLAPWDPPRRLVLRGPYRHVRNPMITGVLAILAGEALLTRAPGLAWWFVGATMINMIYIPLYEERRLRARFGEDYERYSRHVPRWLPRPTPWTDPARGRRPADPGHRGGSNDQASG